MSLPIRACFICVILFSGVSKASTEVVASVTFQKDGKYVLIKDKKKQKYSVSYVMKKGKSKSKMLPKALAMNIETDMLNLIWTAKYINAKSIKCSVAGTIEAKATGEQTDICKEHVKSHQKFSVLKERLADLVK